jgi:hypothetical protein
VTYLAFLLHAITPHHNSRPLAKSPRDGLPPK